MRIRRPAPNPCDSCPYRADAPSGLWAPVEYASLAQYDRVTALQPPGIFACHQVAKGDAALRVCAGWAAVHRLNPRGHELLALRMEARRGLRMTPEDLQVTLTYRTSVELFESGMRAAIHGMAEVDYPSLAAIAAVSKIIKRREDIRHRGDSV